jgi:predicted transcriptional regulator
VNDDSSPDTLLDVLGNERSRQILALASVEPIAAKDIQEYCEVSLPTVYRHVDLLVDFDLLQERTVIDSDGNQKREFQTNLDQLTVEIADGTITVDVSFSHEMVDQYDRLWGDVDRSDGEEARSPSRQTPTE